MDFISIDGACRGEMGQIGKKDEMCRKVWLGTLAEKNGIMQYVFEKVCNIPQLIPIPWPISESWAFVQ